MPTTDRSAARSSEMPKSWQRAAVDEGDILITCASCREQHRHPLAAFKGDATQTIPRLERTGAKLTGGSDQMLRWVLALITYFLVHRAIWGSEVPLNNGILIPVLAATVAFGLAPHLGALLRMAFGRRLAVYTSRCPQCGADCWLASNGEAAVVPKENESAGSSTAKNS